MLDPPAAADRSRRLAAQAAAEVHELTDLQFEPLGHPAMEALGLRPGDSVMDIGCGAGATLLQLAGRVGPTGQVLGVDIAPEVLAIARRRARPLPQVQVIQADAQDLPVPTASVDAVFSRFGVMAFADPVAAFAGFHRVLKPSGKLAFVCWRTLAENEIDRLPLTAAGLDLPPDDTPFSLADAEVIHATLAAAGFGDIAVDAHDEAVSCGDLDATVAVLLRVGAVGRLVREAPALRATVEPRVRETLAARGDPACVTLRAAVWIVSARA